MGQGQPGKAKLPRLQDHQAGFPMHPAQGSHLCRPQVERDPGRRARLGAGFCAVCAVDPQILHGEVGRTLGAFEPFSPQRPCRHLLGHQSLFGSCSHTVIRLRKPSSMATEPM